MADHEDSVSRSRSRDSGSGSRTRTSFSTQMSAIGARISRALSSDREGLRSRNGDDDTASFASTAVEGTDQAKDRSVSRGRESLHSSGRGGIGNIRPSSKDPGGRRVDGPDDFSITRGREPKPATTSGSAAYYSTGRGGAGNMRSPSRDTSRPPTEHLDEQEILRKRAEELRDASRSTGRGGAGNITKSRSRSKGPSSAFTNGRVVGSIAEEDKNRPPEVGVV